MGFSLAKQFRSELMSLRELSLSQKPARHVALVSEHEATCTTLLEGVGAKTLQYKDENAQSWNSDAALNAFSVPIKTLELVQKAVGDMQ